VSTDYYPLKLPITSLSKCDQDEYNYVQLTIKVDGKFCGNLYIKDDEADNIICMLRSDTPVIHTSWGGELVGVIIKTLTAYVPNDMQLISEYGELTTLKELKDFASKQRVRND